MRPWGALICLAAALLSEGCAMVESTSSLRREVRRRRVSEAANGELRLAVTRAGTVANVSITRERRCLTRTVIEGEDDVQRTRRPSPENPVTLLAGGAILAAITGLSVMACPAICQESDEGSALRDPATALPLGGAIVGVGGLLAIPWIYNLSAGGTTTETRPWTETVPGPAEPCGETPERAVVQVGPPGGARVERVTDAQGRLSLDLATDLPPEALRGPAPWREVHFTIPASPIAVRERLADYRAAAAETAWTAATAPEAFDAFARDFPTDERVSEARARAVRIRNATAALARDEERRERWTAAGDDPTRLQAIVDESLVDAWDCEVRCRLGAAANGEMALRAALTACATCLDALPPEARARNADILTSAARSRERLDARIAEAVRASVEAEARASEARERAARRAAAEAHRALQRSREIVAACRAGRATGVSAAREAYIALARAQRGGASGAGLAVQIAAACRCTPACAGVTP